MRAHIYNLGTQEVKSERFQALDSLFFVKRAYPK